MTTMKKPFSVARYPGGTGIKEADGRLIFTVVYRERLKEEPDVFLSDEVVKERAEKLCALMNEYWGD